MDWHKRYSARWRAKCRSLDPFVEGCFLRLTDEYIETGKALPDDDGDLAGICRISVGEFLEKVKPFLFVPKFFRKDGGRWVQNTCDELIGERNASVEFGAKGAAKRWKKEKDLERSTANTISRDARLSNARKIAKHTPHEWQELASFCDFNCVKCGAEGVVKDHIKPIYQGGSDGIENLQPLCKRCNSSKGPENKDYRPNNWRDCLKNLPTPPTAPLPAEREKERKIDGKESLVSTTNSLKGTSTPKAGASDKFLVDWKSHDPHSLLESGTIERAKKWCPRWDIHGAVIPRWWAHITKCFDQKPRDYNASFVGWCKKHIAGKPP